MLSLALALGFDGVVAILMTVVWVLNPPPLGSRSPAIFLLGSFSLLAVCCGAALCWLVVVRRRFWRLPRMRQWQIGIGLFLAIGAGHAAFGAWLGIRLH